MDNNEIKAQIDRNNEMIEQLVKPEAFALNTAVAKLLEDNIRLQKMCVHKFEEGKCIYCYQLEEDK